MANRRKIALLAVAGATGALLVWIAGALVELSEIYHPDVYQDER